MKRGRYSAWVYVVLAFPADAALLGGVPGVIGALLLDAVGVIPEVAGAIIILSPFLLGLPLATLIFWNRWP